MVLYCLVPNFKLKCENSENINADHVDSHFQLTSNQMSGIF